MRNIELLKKSGIDYEEGLERFSGNAVLYEKYLNKLVSLPLYGEMRAAIKQNDIASAFSSAHKLKSFLGNLSIHGLYEDICELTETLRAGGTPQVEQLLELDNKYFNVINLIKGESHE